MAIVTIKDKDLPENLQVQGLVESIAIVFDNTKTQNCLNFEYYFPCSDGFGLPVASRHSELHFLNCSLVVVALFENGHA